MAAPSRVTTHRRNRAFALNLHGSGIHIAPVKFSTVMLKNSASILALKFSYG